jgi:hypothetical protein
VSLSSIRRHIRNDPLITCFSSSFSASNNLFFNASHVKPKLHYIPLSTHVSLSSIKVDVTFTFQIRFHQPPSSTSTHRTNPATYPMLPLSLRAIASLRKVVIVFGSLHHIIHCLHQCKQWSPSSFFLHLIDKTFNDVTPSLFLTPKSTAAYDATTCDSPTTKKHINTCSGPS